LRRGTLDFGGRVIELQQEIRAIEERLAHEDTAAALSMLEAAEADLALLRGSLSDAIANDPNLLALEDHLHALRQRLE
jgi:hypothetical protein